MKGRQKQGRKKEGKMNSMRGRQKQGKKRERKEGRKN